MATLIFKSILALVFIITSGAVFAKYFKNRPMIGFFAALVAVVSAIYFLVEVVGDIRDVVAQPSPQPIAKQEPTPQPKEEQELPPGTYEASCENCKFIKENIVACNCKKRSGGYRHSTIDITTCNPQILHNSDGRLKCGN